MTEERASETAALRADLTTAIARAERAEARVAGLYFAMEQIAQGGPRGFAEAERIAKAAIAAAKG